MIALGCVAAVLAGCPADEDPFVPYAGLSADVTIRRDSQGVAHIDGANQEDVFFASGYMQAFDRYTEMQQTRLRANGRRSEYNSGAFGDDLVLRTVNIPELGRQNMELIRSEEPELFRLVDAWTKGVNRYVAEVRAGELPRPPGLDGVGMPLEEWENADVFRIGKLYLFGNANQLEYDILATVFERYFPEVLGSLRLSRPLYPAFSMPPEERPTRGDVTLSAQGGEAWPLPADARERFAAFGDRLRDYGPGASNNWAVDGQHTDNGRPIIAGDPHQGLGYPPIFHMQHLRSADGELDVIGWAFNGTPAIQLGHNRHIAWTATTTYPDWMDIYEVRPTDDGAGIHYAGEIREIVERVEEFVQPDGTVRRETIRDVPGVGVMLPEGTSPVPIAEGGRELLFRWAGMQPTREILGFYRFDTAASIEDMEAAVDGLELGAFNFVFADASGIGYRSSPLLPARGTPGTYPDPSVVLDGDDPANNWTRFEPVERLPRSRGGERGWLATANNDPFGFTSDGAVDGDDLYFGTFFDPGMRAQRIYDELERVVARGDVTVDDMRTLQRDVRVLTADLLLPRLDGAFDALASDEDLVDFREDADLEALHARLMSWDRQMVRESSDALVYQVFLFYVIEAVIGDDINLFFDALVEAGGGIFAIKFALQALEIAPNLVQAGERVVMLRSLARTRDHLVAEYGGIEAERYQWGDVHGIALGSGYGSEYDVAWVPTNGADGTVDVAPSPFIREGQIRTHVDTGSGAVYRLVASFDEDGTPNATYTYAGGHSLDPGSEWFANQWTHWVEGNYQPLHFREADIAADVAESMTLAP